MLLIYLFFHFIVALYSIFNLLRVIIQMRNKISALQKAFVVEKLHRKEVIQPHVPVRLPCYDFTPLIRHTFDGSVLTVQPPASGTPNSGGVTGGVYKARERIHRSLADLRLLAIPAS